MRMNVSLSCALDNLTALRLYSLRPISIGLPGHGTPRPLCLAAAPLLCGTAILAAARLLVGWSDRARQQKEPAETRLQARLPAHHIHSNGHLVLTGAVAVKPAPLCADEPPTLRESKSNRPVPWDYLWHKRLENIGDLKNRPVADRRCIRAEAGKILRR
jgi:hypothetical protein